MSKEKCPRSFQASTTAGSAKLEEGEQPFTGEVGEIRELLLWHSTISSGDFSREIF